MTSQEHDRIADIRQTVGGLLLFGSGTVLTSVAVLYGHRLVYRQYLDPIAGVPFAGVLGVVVLLPLVLVAGLIGLCFLLGGLTPRIAGRTEYTIAGLAGLTGVVAALLQAILNTLPVTLPLHPWPFPVESSAAVAVVALSTGYLCYRLYSPGPIIGIGIPADQSDDLDPEFVRQRTTVRSSEPSQVQPHPPADDNRSDRQTETRPWTNHGSESSSSDGESKTTDWEFDWTTDTGVNFSDIGGMEDLKTRLEREVIRPLTTDRERAEALGIHAPNVLLYGPPGTGKTFVAKAVANELDLPFVRLSGADVTSKWINESPERINRLFTEAQRMAAREGGAVIFLDELDSVLKARSGAGRAHEEDNKIVNEFLAHLQETKDHDVVFIGATNRREALDEAATRRGRIDREIEIGIPDLDARTEILRARLRFREQELSEHDLTTVAEHTDGFSAAELEGLVEDAARVAAFERGDDTITLHDFFIAGKWEG